MASFSKVLLPLVILSVMGGTAYYLSTQTPPAEKVPHRAALIPVTAAVLQPQDELSGVASFFGTWPGDETDEDLLQALQAIR